MPLEAIDGFEKVVQLEKEKGTEVKWYGVFEHRRTPLLPPVCPLCMRLCYCMVHGAGALKHCEHW